MHHAVRVVRVELEVRVISFGVACARGLDRGAEEDRICEEYTPSTLDTYPFLNPLQHVNTVTMSELITTSSAYIINGDSPMTSVANTVAMTTLAVHTLQPHIFYKGTLPPNNPISIVPLAETS